MTIEFRCTECQKLLRTSDDKAGVTAKCPQCGIEILVPSPSESLGTAAAAMGEPASGQPAEPARTTESSQPGLRPCPMCGEQIRDGATRCRFCGESLRNSTRPPGSLEVGSVLSRSWAIFKADMGTTMGVVLLPMFIVMVAYYAVAIAVALLTTGLGIMGPFGGNPDPWMFIVMQAVQNGVLSIVMCGLLSLLTPGMYQCLLRIARGERVDIGDVFRGGPYIVRFFASSIMLSALYWLLSIVTMYPLTFAFLQQAAKPNGEPTLMIFTGILYFAGIVVMVVIQLMTWPFGFVLVDQNPPGVQCVFQSIPLTKGTRLTAFALGIIASLLFAGGCIAACVGLLFTIPLIILMTAVMYCDLTGQSTAA